MENNLNKKINPFEEPELGLCKMCSDKYYYLILFFAGLAFLLLGSVLYMLPPLFIANIIGTSTDAEEIINSIYTYQGFIGAVSEIVGIALMVIFLRLVFVNDYFRFKRDWKKNLIIIIVSIILIIGMSYLFDWIYKVFNITTDSANQEVIEKTLSGKGKWAMVLQTAIVAPIFEELVFRKTIFGYLNKTALPRVLVVFIVAMLFALVHMTSENFLDWKTYVYLFNYLSLSLVLVYSYRLTKGNIYASIIVHMFNNIYALLITFGVINVFIH